MKLMLFLAPLLWTTAGAAASVYVVNATNQFGTVDLGTGSFHQIGPDTPEPNGNLIAAPNGKLYSIATLSGNLITIDPASGATNVVGPTGLGADAFGLASLGGKLYLTDFSNNLYTVNPTTGAATFVRATGVPPDPAVPFTMNADGTINLCDETLYGMGDKLFATFDAYSINPSTLAVTQVVAPELWSIDPNSGVATDIASTSLNLDATFEEDGNFYAFRVVTTQFGEFGPDAYSELLDLNLGDGSTSFVRDIDPAAGPIFGASPVPEPTSFSIGALGLVASCLGVWRRRRS